MTDLQIAEELSVIKEDIKEKIWEMKRLLRNVDNLTRERAMSYWIPQLEIALDKEHDWLGGCMFTLQDTIDALDYEEEEVEDEED